MCSMSIKKNSSQRLYLILRGSFFFFLFPLQMQTSLASLILVKMEYLASALHLLPCSLWIYFSVCKSAPHLDLSWKWKFSRHGVGCSLSCKPIRRPGKTVQPWDKGIMAQHRVRNNTSCWKPGNTFPVSTKAKTNKTHKTWSMLCK